VAKRYVLLVADADLSDGGGRIVNLILYNQLEEPRSAREGYLGLTPDNVQVRYRPATPEREDPRHAEAYRQSAGRTPSLLA
jgi:hypothetical protein